jgi:glucosamine-6-phosphate deaminase
MRTFIRKNEGEVGRKGASIVEEVLRESPDFISLPTGKTPLPMYRELRKRNAHLMSHDTTFVQLDEYLNVAEKDSFRQYLKQEMRGIEWKRVLSLPNDVKAIKDVRLDLLVLGLGRNGHIAFLEPGTSARGRLLEVELRKETRLTNKTKARKAITFGMESILDAKRIVMLVAGKEKREAVHLMFTHEKNMSFPATLVRDHQDLTLIADEKSIS